MQWASRLDRTAIMHPPDARSLPAWKKGIFALLTLVVALSGLESVLYLSGVEPLSRQSDPYVGFSSRMPHFVESSRAEGTATVTVAPSKLKSFNPQSFSPRKPAGTFRVFCVGGSTTYGRPFFDRTSFAGWLRALLPAVDPSRSWEVINAGGISYASYRVARVVDELCRFQPDLFVVYVGHNEFLERRTYAGLLNTPAVVTELGGLVNRTRTAALLRAGFARLGIGTASEAKRTSLGDQVHAIPINAVGPDAYTRDDALKAQVVAHFRFNVNRIVAMARQAGAAVVLVTPASNLADFAPFKSEHRPGLSPTDRDAWQADFDTAKRRMASADWRGARDAFARAETIDDRYAELHFRLGQVLVQLGDFAAARTRFDRAKEEDICPLRAIDAIVSTIRGIAEDRGIPLVDFNALVTDRSEHHLPGGAFFHDHVHPRIAANRDLALQIIASMAGAGLVRGHPPWNQAAVAAAVATVDAHIDRQAHAVELGKLSEMLEWLGHHRQARQAAIEALDLSGDSADSLYHLGTLLARQGDREGAIRDYRQAIEKRPDFAAARLQLGLIFFRKGDAEHAIDQLRRAVAVRDDLAAAHSTLGLLFSQRGDLEEALRQFAKAAELEPDSHTSENNLGLALAHLGRYQEAIPHYRRAIELNAKNSSAHLNLGIALEATGHWEEAIKCYRNVLRLHPDHAGARRRLRALETGGTKRGRSS